MKKLRLKKRAEIVAGVQWTGYNLLEVQMFMGTDEGFPKNENQHNMLISLQDKCRDEGLKIPHISTRPPYKETIATAHMIGDWVVKYSDGSFRVCPDKSLRMEYDIEEGF